MKKQNDLDSQQLKSTIAYQERQINALTSEKAGLQHKIEILAQENIDLRAKIQQLLHERYGKKSEKIPEEILPIIDEAVITPAEAAAIAETEQQIAVASYTRTKPQRKPIPQEFAREQIIHDLPLAEQVCGCGAKLHCIGADTHEQLDYIPAKVKVLVHVRKKYGCRDCEIGIAIAPMPKDFLPKSLAAPGLLSHVILSKYEDHMPLYRQEKVWQRLGIELARSTLCNWVLLAAQGLHSLLALQQEELLKLNYIRADETPVQVMEENKIRTSKRAYMWVFASGCSEKPILVYKFAMTRAGSIAAEFLGDFNGFLQTDGFTGYNQVVSKNLITHVGCMAHARRKFAAIVKITKKAGAAHYAVAVIAKLYEIERIIKEKKLTTDAVKEYRQQHAQPILLAFKDWLITKQTQAPPQSPLGKAVFYFLEHWDELVVYLEHGFLDIDNNFTEQKIKPFVIGRKNWLFMGNERGGEAAATFFSLIESAKANGLNTYAYFRYIMTQLPLINKHNREALLSLLPHRVDLAVLQKYLI